MRRKTVLIVFLSVAIIAVAGGVFMWNKPHETVDNKTGIKVTAQALTGAFESNEQAANKKYLNQVVEVSGVISEISKNQDGRMVVLLESDNPLSGVQCTMRDDNKTFSNGQQTTIKGFCSGYTSVVLLTDCVEVK